MKVWSQVRQGRVILARIDYIMGKDRRSFEIMGKWGVRN